MDKQTKKDKDKKGERRQETGKNRATKLDDVLCGMRLFQGSLVKDGTAKDFLPTKKGSKHAKKRFYI